MVLSLPNRERRGARRSIERIALYAESYRSTLVSRLPTPSLLRQASAREVRRQRVPRMSVATSDAYRLRVVITVGNGGSVGAWKHAAMKGAAAMDIGFVGCAVNGRGIHDGR